MQLWNYEGDDDEFGGIPTERREIYMAHVSCSFRNPQI